MLDIVGEQPVTPPDTGEGDGRAHARLALSAGVTVDGIELSPAMIDQLRARPGGADLDVTCGDMATTTLPGRYRLVFVVFNSIMNLLAQDEQVACVENAARHLRDDGVFVVENVVPDPMSGEPFDGRSLRHVSVYERR